MLKRSMYVQRKCECLNTSNCPSPPYTHRTTMLGFLYCCTPWPAPTAMAASFAAAKPLFSPCLPFCSIGPISPLRSTWHLSKSKKYEKQKKTDRPFGESQVHVSPPLGLQSWLFLQGASNNPWCNSKVTIVTAGSYQHAEVWYDTWMRYYTSSLQLSTQTPFVRNLGGLIENWLLTNGAGKIRSREIEYHAFGQPCKAKTCTSRIMIWCPLK